MLASISTQQLTGQTQSEQHLKLHILRASAVTLIYDNAIGVYRKLLLPFLGELPISSSKQRRIFCTQL
jgi:hypothetical protein